ncbi:MAG: substrate-binding domain-containing protein [Armatimonadota bacterium]
MKLNKAIILSIALLGLSVLFVSCKKEYSTVDKSKKEPILKVIGISLPDDTPDIKELESAIKEQCDIRNIKCIVMYADNNQSIELSNVEKFISDKMDAIALYPISSESFNKAIDIINEYNIPLFGINTHSENENVVSNIHSDFNQIGINAADYMSNIIPNEGNVIAITEDNLSGDLILQGIKDSILKSENLKLYSTYKSNGSIDTTLEYIKAVIEKSNNVDISGFFVMSDSLKTAVAGYLQDSGYKHIMVIGMGRNSESDNMIISNSPLKAVAVEYPNALGKVTIDTIANYLIEEVDVPRHIPVRIGLVDNKKLKNKSNHIDE